MYTRYQQKRTVLVNGLLAMASHAEAALVNATRSYVQRDDAAARLVEENDDVLDHFEVELDEVAIAILTMAPLAAELRLVAVSMRISQNLERVGDQAVLIARHALALNAEPQLKPYIDLPRMAAIAREMLHEAVSAFVDRNVSKAHAVVARDAEVDGLNHQVHRELSSYIIERSSNIPRCLDVLEIAKAIERIADHATNIAEQVVYLCDARDIRHAGKRQHEFARSHC